MPPSHPRGKYEVERNTEKKQRNMFSVLADSDTDNEVDVAECKQAGVGHVSPFFVPEGEVADADAEASDDKPAFRVWTQAEEENRFKTEEIKNNIFSSPFSKGKKVVSRQWSRPRFKENEEGWTSIRWNQPQFQNEEEVPEGELQPEEVHEEAEAEADADAFPSLRKSEPWGSSRPDQEPVSAVVWAERIRRSLERAEASRAAKSKDNRLVDQDDFKESLGRLSFFRRPVIAEIVLTE
jgi:hypothetical protein